jgi:hypothetical protein
MFNGKIQYKWPFSIAMLNYQRVFFDREIARNFDRIPVTKRKVSETAFMV